MYRQDTLVAELVLDRGAIEAAGRRERFREIEVELKGAGTIADLHAICDRLAELLPLAPEPRSRFERGLALLAAPAAPTHVTPAEESLS